MSKQTWRNNPNGNPDGPTTLSGTGDSQLRRFRRGHSGNSQPGRDARYRTDRWLHPEMDEQGIAQSGALLTKNEMGQVNSEVG
jgi:hypothetical protein